MFDESTDPPNIASTGGHVKRNKNVTGETAHWPSNTEEGSSEESSPVNQYHTGLHDDPSMTSEKMETNETVTGGTSHKLSNIVEGSSEENTSVNETGLHDDSSTSEKVERNNTIADVTSDEPSSDEEGSSEKYASQPLLNATSPSPRENKTSHSVATALDGTRLKCAKCENIQGVIFNQTYFTVKVIAGELMAFIFPTVCPVLCAVYQFFFCDLFLWRMQTSH